MCCLNAGVGTCGPRTILVRPPDLQRKNSDEALPFMSADIICLFVDRQLDSLFDTNLTPSDPVFNYSLHPKTVFFFSKLQRKISNFWNCEGPSFFMAIFSTKSYTKCPCLGTPSLSYSSAPSPEKKMILMNIMCTFAWVVGPCCGSGLRLKSQLFLSPRW